MQEYEVTNADGITLTLQLDEAEAKERGLIPKQADPVIDPEIAAQAAADAAKAEEEKRAAEEAAKAADAAKADETATAPADGVEKAVRTRAGK